MPTAGTDARDGWRERLRRFPVRNRCYRGLVFIGGLVLVVVGGVLWMFSVVLMLPVALAGLWLWSTEFLWGRRLFRAFVGWGRRLWKRIKARPRRWTMITLASIATGALAYWLIGRSGLLEHARTAIGL